MEEEIGQGVLKAGEYTVIVFPWSRRAWFLVDNYDYREYSRSALWNTTSSSLKLDQITEYLMPVEFME